MVTFGLNIYNDILTDITNDYYMEDIIGIFLGGSLGAHALALSIIQFTCIHHPASLKTETVYQKYLSVIFPVFCSLSFLIFRLTFDKDHDSLKENQNTKNFLLLILFNIGVSSLALLSGLFTTFLFSLQWIPFRIPTDIENRFDFFFSQEEGKNVPDDFKGRYSTASEKINIRKKMFSINIVILIYFFAEDVLEASSLDARIVFLAAKFVSYIFGGLILNESLKKNKKIFPGSLPIDNTVLDELGTIPSIIFSFFIADIIQYGPIFVFSGYLRDQKYNRDELKDNLWDIIGIMSAAIFLKIVGFFFATRCCLKRDEQNNRSCLRFRQYSGSERLIQNEQGEYSRLSG